MDGRYGFSIEMWSNIQAEQGEPPSTHTMKHLQVVWQELDGLL